MVNIDNFTKKDYYKDRRYIEVRYIERRYSIGGVFMRKSANKFLPLTETTYLILASLWQPLHGYGIMQNVERITNSRILLAPGTLYGALSKLTKDNLIEVVDVSLEVDRKKTYALTTLGREVVEMEFKRLETLVMESKKMLGGVNFEEY